MRRALLVGALALTAALPGHAHVGSHEIAVRDGYFDPIELRVDVGETVTWNVLHSGHTITADDGRFNFPGDRLTRQGDRFQFVFTRDETVYFHCQVHRSGMFGVIVVGDGTPPKPPTQELPEVRSVPSSYPTIGAALATAPARTIIEIAPGFYREPIVADVPGVVLRGTGATPTAVSLEGMREHGVGVTVAADDVTIENLLIRDHTFAGIFAERVDGLRLERLELLENERYGLRAVGIRGLAVRQTRATGSARAGYSVQDCRRCDAVFDAVTAEDNLTGIEATNAGAIVITRSLVRGNGTGIALKSFPGAGAPQRGAHVHGNEIRDNVHRPRVRPPVTDSFQIPSGVGVWISGGWLDIIDRNLVTGHVYNIAVTGFTGPSMLDRVSGNTVGHARAADVAWDGIGASVCFSGNRRADGSAASSDPPAAELLYGCGLPATAGIPNPLVPATILAHARI